ncbi:MAG: hypothetical protein ACK559_19965, partial [bacterium]
MATAGADDERPRTRWSDGSALRAEASRLRAASDAASGEAQGSEQQQKQHGQALHLDQRDRQAEGEAGIEAGGQPASDQQTQQQQSETPA